MHAGNTAAMLTVRSDHGYRQGRGVGGENSVRPAKVFELFERFLFNVDVFDDGFDDKVAIFEAIHAITDANQGHRFRCIGLLEALFLDSAAEHFFNKGAGLDGDTGLTIGYEHRKTTQRGDLSDTTPHGTGTEDANGEIFIEFFMGHELGRFFNQH